jgi:4-amino-4-deoxy-L-arabinose transferase-like glycosyltransferase
VIAPGSPRRGDALGLVVLLALSALLLLPTLGQRWLSDSHEARFALLARDMLERGTAWRAEVGGQVYRNKPPLYPWSIALFSLPGGRVTEATAQAPLALAAIAAVGITWELGRRLFGLRSAWLAGLVLLAFFDFFAYSQVLFPEMLVAAFAVAALALLWCAAGAPPSPGARAAFWVALALGVFAKGPAGLLPLAVGAAWLWTEDGPRGIRRLWSPWGLAAFAAITLGWLAPFLAMGGGSFARDVVWTDWLDWFVGLPTPRHLVRLAGEVALGTLPWSLLLPLAIARGVREWRDPRARLLLLAIAVPVALVALSHNPRARYLLPAYPAAALLVAWWAEARAPAGGPAVRAAGWGSLGLGLLFASAPFWFRPVPRHFLPADPAMAVGLGALVALGGASLALGLARGRPAPAVAGAAAAILLTYVVGIRAYNEWNNAAWNYRQVGALVARESRGARAVAFFGRDVYQIDFYAGRPLAPITTLGEVQRELAAPDRPVITARGRPWRSVAGQPLPPHRVLGRLRAGEDEFIVLRGE